MVVVMEREVYTVVGYSKGVTKKGDAFTKVALTFQSPFKGFEGLDVVSHFIYADLDIGLGQCVYLEYGCRQDGKAYVRNLIPA